MVHKLFTHSPSLTHSLVALRMDRRRRTKDKVALFTVSLFLLLTEELVTEQRKHEGSEGLRKDEGREGEKKGMVSFCRLSPLLYCLDFLSLSPSLQPSLFVYVWGVFSDTSRSFLIRVRENKMADAGWLDFSIVEGNPSILFCPPPPTQRKRSSDVNKSAVAARAER